MGVMAGVLAPISEVRYDVELWPGRDAQKVTKGEANIKREIRYSDAERT